MQLNFYYILRVLRKICHSLPTIESIVWHFITGKGPINRGHYSQWLGNCFGFIECWVIFFLLSYISVAPSSSGSGRILHVETLYHITYKNTSNFAPWLSISNLQFQNDAILTLKFNILLGEGPRPTPIPNSSIFHFCNAIYLVNASL